MKRVLLGVLALIVTGAGLLAGPVAQGEDFQSCNGVWVIVDFGSIGGDPRTQCATDFGTGTAALRSAGFSLNLTDGFLNQINSKPAKPDAKKAYWSYWHASVKADGSYGSWAYSNLGADAYHPTKGNAEGWHYISMSEAGTGPGIAPPKNPPAAKPKPSATPTKTASSKPTASKSASKTASASPSASRSATPSATPVSTPPPSPTPTTISSATPVAIPAPAEPAGAPTGLIIAAVVVVAGGGGLALWWFWKGRRR